VAVHVPEPMSCATSEPVSTTRRRYRTVVLPAIVLFSLLINSYHLQWGLPNGNTTWAADAITPMGPLAIGHKSLASPNSGWFYFKYPIGHHMLLLAAYGPYFAWLHLTHGVSRLQGAYPYGLKNPERALTVLALIGRGVSVLMATGAIVIVYAIAELFFGAGVAVFAAAAASCCMGVVYYAHTTNLDVPVMFWMLLALLFGLRLMHDIRWSDVIGLGIASGMALATKEFALGMLVPLPLFILYGQSGRIRNDTGHLSHMVKRLAVGIAISVCTYALATNAFYNPAGLFNRWRFLTGTLPAEYYGRLVPRPSMIDMVAGLPKHLRLVRELGVALTDDLGFPLCAAALAGFVLTLIRSPRVAGLFLVLLASYYYFALAPVPLVTVRYVLPLGMLLAVLAGLCLHTLAQRAWVGRGLAIAVLLATFAYGASVDYLLILDPRYQAEAWLEQHARGRTVETYNRDVFLPRFPKDVRLVQPKFDELTIAGLRQRQPDFILLNMADLSRVTGTMDTHVAVIKRRKENEEFLSALLAGRLGYDRVARFHTASLVRDGAIRSLNPEIVIFGSS
jgi:hypothetical protein